MNTSLFRQHSILDCVQVTCTNFDEWCKAVKQADLHNIKNVYVDAKHLLPNTDVPQWNADKFLKFVNSMHNIRFVIEVPMSTHYEYSLTDHERWEYVMLNLWWYKLHDWPENIVMLVSIEHDRHDTTGEKHLLLSQTIAEYTPAHVPLIAEIWRRRDYDAVKGYADYIISYSEVAHSQNIEWSNKNNIDDAVKQQRTSVFELFECEVLLLERVLSFLYRRINSVLKLWSKLKASFKTI